MTASMPAQSDDSYHRREARPVGPEMVWVQEPSRDDALDGPMALAGIEHALGRGGTAPAVIEGSASTRRWSDGVHLAYIVKQGLDRVLALLGLLCLLPILLLVGLAVKATSSGPALYRSERVGRNGEPFHMWKFRTMRDGAHGQMNELLKRHGRNGVPLFKIPNDPRITSLGRVLRRTSIDELPQLLNVLTGEMSLVGPRPQMPGEVALYSSRERLRLQVRPGMTGLWQVSGRSALSWHEALECDFRYIREWSLLLDVKILAMTVLAVARKDGAL